MLTTEKCVRQNDGKERNFSYGRHVVNLHSAKTTCKMHTVLEYKNVLRQIKWR
jgi:hypothetical protein